MRRIALLLSLLSAAALADTVRQVPTPINSDETPACGASPCSATSTIRIFAPNTARGQCGLQPVMVAATDASVPWIFSSRTSTLSFAVGGFQWMLSAAASTSTPGAWGGCNQGPRIDGRALWGMPVGLSGTSTASIAVQAGY